MKYPGRITAESWSHVKVILQTRIPKFIDPLHTRNRISYQPRKWFLLKRELWVKCEVFFQRVEWTIIILTTESIRGNLSDRNEAKTHREIIES